MPIPSNLGQFDAPKLLARPVQFANEQANSKKRSNRKTNSKDQVHPIPTGSVPVIPQSSSPFNPVFEIIQRELLVGNLMAIVNPIQLMANKFLEE